MTGQQRSDTETHVCSRPVGKVFKSKWAALLVYGHWRGRTAGHPRCRPTYSAIALNQFIFCHGGRLFRNILTQWPLLTFRLRLTLDGGWLRGRYFHSADAWSLKLMQWLRCAEGQAGSQESSLRLIRSWSVFPLPSLNKNTLNILSTWYCFGIIPPSRRKTHLPISDGHKII